MEKLTNIELNKSATFDHFCSQNEILPTKIYSHIMISDHRITTHIHFIITNIAGATANTKAYIIKQTNQNTMSHESAIQILVVDKKYNGLTGKLR